MSTEPHTIPDYTSMLRLTGFIERLHNERCERRGVQPSFLHASVSPLTTIGKRFAHISSPSSGQGVSIEEALRWLKICAPAAYSAGYGDDEPEERKTLMWACRLLGLGWGDVHKAIGDCRSFGFEKAAEAWARWMKPVDDRYVGFVYTAYAKSDRQVVKVGFSLNPEKRMKALSRECGEEVVLLSATPATILHEWALHQLIRFQVKSEWYRAEHVPGWLTCSAQEAA